MEPDVDGTEGAGGAGGDPGFDIDADAGTDPTPQTQADLPDTGFVRLPDDTGDPRGGSPPVDLEPRPLSAALRPVNGSTVEGTVFIEIGAGQVRAEVDVRGLWPGASHAQQLHQGPGAACPSGGADGWVDAAELIAAAGPPVATFEPMLADHNGRFGWFGSAAADPDPLSPSVYVVYGAMRGDQFDPTAPAACGVVSR